MHKPSIGKFWFRWSRYLKVVWLQMCYASTLWGGRLRECTHNRCLHGARDIKPPGWQRSQLLCECALVTGELSLGFWKALPGHRPIPNSMLCLLADYSRWDRWWKGGVREYYTQIMSCIAAQICILKSSECIRCILILYQECDRCIGEWVPALTAMGQHPTVLYTPVHAIQFIFC